MTYQFEPEFDTNSSIGWWNTNRGFANHGIKCFNAWQLAGCPASEKRVVLANIAYARRMSSYEDVGGLQNDYEDLFDRMEKFVNDAEEEV